MSSHLAHCIRHHSGRLYCLQETGHAFVLDAHQGENNSLVRDIGAHLKTWDGEWDRPFSAHPRFGLVTRGMYNHGLDSASNTVAGRISKRLRNSQAACNQTQGLTIWLHNFFLTGNYVVFADSSMRRDFSGLTRAADSVFSFDNDNLMRFGVIPREFNVGDNMKWFTTKTSSNIWHVTNAWEQTPRRC